MSAVPVLAITREQVLSFQVGDGLDELVAEQIMGLPRAELGGHCPNYYSTDIAAAWEVVEKLRTDGFSALANTTRPSHGAPIGAGAHAEFQSIPDGRWFVAFFRAAGIRCSGDGAASADTLPLAICRAALLTRVEE